MGENLAVRPLGRLLALSIIAEFELKLPVAATLMLMLLVAPCTRRSVAV